MPFSGVYRNNTLLLPRSPIFVFTHPRLGATGGRARHALGYAVHGQICGGRGVMARGSWPLALVLVRNKLKPEHAQPPVYVRTCAAVLLGGCQRPWGLAFQEHQAAQAARARRGGGTGPVVRGK